MTPSTGDPQFDSWLDSINTFSAGMFPSMSGLMTDTTGADVWRQYYDDSKDPLTALNLRFRQGK